MPHLATAITKPHSRGEGEEALRPAGVQGMTATEVRGFGRQGGHTETYRGAEYKIDFLPKVRPEVLTGRQDAQGVRETIADAARTGQIGDGKIWITAVDRAVRIRTGEM